ncbi:MAG: hypothetical protein ACT4PJ_16235 [Gemmatimonadaceae bacterium]
MADSTRQRMRSEEYNRYVDIAAGARSAAELAELRAQLRSTWPEDATAQLLAEVLYDQEQSFDAPDGARAQAGAVWHDDPTLLQHRRTRRFIVDPSAEEHSDGPTQPPPGGAA